MEKEKLQQYISDRYSIRNIAKVIGRSQGSVRYWLKKYNLKTKCGPKPNLDNTDELVYKCACGETDPSNFYGHKNKICSRCHNKQNLKRGHKNRELALKYLGNKCCRKNCNYSEYQCSLDIHHINPDIKDMSFKNMRYWSWKRLKKELDKCVLLCKNCHAAYHSGLIEL